MSSGRLLKAKDIIRWKDFGPIFSPNGIELNLKDPFSVEKDVKFLDSSSSPI